VLEQVDDGRVLRNAEVGKMLGWEMLHQPEVAARTDIPARPPRIWVP
jgi:hypothetical protein